MPIYEYRCQECGHELEILQRMADAPLQECPACEQPGLRRLISAAGFRLKGSGWYETDFKQGQKRNLADRGEAGKADSPDQGKGGKTDAGASTAAAGSGKEAAASPASTAPGT